MNATRDSVGRELCAQAHRRVALTGQRSFLFLFFPTGQFKSLNSSGLGKKMKKKRKCETADAGGFHPLRISSHSEARTRNCWYDSLVLCAHYVWLSSYSSIYLGHKVVRTRSVALWAQIMEELFFFPFLLGRIIIHFNAAQRRKENKEKESLCPFSSSVNILWMRKKALRAQRFTGH